MKAKSGSSFQSSNQKGFTGRQKNPPLLNPQDNNGIKASLFQRTKSKEEKVFSASKLTFLHSYYYTREVNVMPEFGTAFSGRAEKELLTHEELVRSIRFMIAAEYEAIQLYTQLAESTDNKLAQEVLIDIANEERVHAGEFLRLLKELAPDEEQFYKEGAKEVEEEIGKLKK